MVRTSLFLVLLMSLPLTALAEVTCGSEYGSCTMEGSSASCECANGTSEGMDSASVGDEEPVEPTEEECIALLSETCTELPKDPEEECSADELSFCTTVFEVGAGCLEDLDEPADWEIVNCCESYREEQEAMDEVLQCLQDTACEDWEGTCYESDGDREGTAIGEDSGDNQNGDDSDEAAGWGDLFGGLDDDDDDSANTADEQESDDDDDDAGSAADDDDSGCSATGSASVLWLLGLAGLARRKRG